MLRHYVANILPNGLNAQVVAYSRRAAVNGPAQRAVRPVDSYRLVAQPVEQRHRAVGAHRDVLRDPLR